MVNNYFLKPNNVAGKIQKKSGGKTFKKISPAKNKSFKNTKFFVGDLLYTTQLFRQKKGTRQSINTPFNPSTS